MIIVGLVTLYLLLIVGAVILTVMILELIP